VPGSGEPADVGADLGDDHLDRQTTDPGDGSQQPDRGAERDEVTLHLLVDAVNGSLQRINLAQMKPQQEAVPLVEPSGQGRTQPLWRHLDPTLHQCGQLLRIRFAADQQFQDGAVGKPQGYC
jgi:hypothetical protein